MTVSEIKAEKAPAPVGPYAQAVVSGSTLYCSGTLPLDPVTGEIVGAGDVQEEARQVLKNLDSVLKKAGGSRGNVMRCTVFLTDFKDFAKVNEVYTEYFKDNEVFPSRSCIEVGALPKGVKVEIDCIAELAASVSEINADKAPAPVGPYAQAVMAGSTLYCSGTLPLDPLSGDIVGAGDVQEEARQVLKNLDSVLMEAGASRIDVMRCTVFLTDFKDFAKVNEVYTEYFKDNAVFPSRSCIEVGALPNGVQVEIDCIAELVSSGKEIVEIKASKAPAPVGPYAQAVLAGSTLYCSGTLPLDPVSGEIVGAGDVQEEARQVLKNLDAVLKEAGVSRNNVVRCTVFLTDFKDFAKVNETYTEYFKENSVFPSRSCIEVGALPKGVQVEIDCIAVP